MALNASGVAKGAKDGERALEQLADAVEDVGRDGARDLDRLEDSLKEVQRQSERTESAVDDIGDGSKKGFGLATEASGEFKSEALANFSEVTSSFDGSMSSIQDLAQGTLGGLAATGLPGIGIAAGAAALAVGGIGAAFNANAEAEEAAKERASEWAQAYIDAGGTVLTAAITSAKALDIITDSEQFKKASENAADWGVSTSTAVAAMAGESWALEAAQAALAKRTAESNAEMEAQEKSSEGASHAAFDMQEKVERGADSMRKLTADMNAGAQQADTYSDYLRTMAANTEGATSKVDKFGDTVYDLPDGTKVYVDAETGQATQDMNAIERKIYAVDGKTAKVKVTVDSSDWDNWTPKQKKASIVVSGSAGTIHWE